MTLLRSARVTGAAHAGAGTRRTLLFAEVALALVLVTGAGLMLRTMSNLLGDRHRLHARAAHHGAVQPAAALRPAEAAGVPRSGARAHLRAMPGVTNAAFTYSLPVAGSNWNSIFIVEGQPVPERSKLPSSAWTPVSEEYFDTMGIRC